jgi:hypothetical protein
MIPETIFKRKQFYVMLETLLTLVVLMDAEYDDIALLYILLALMADQPKSPQSIRTSKRKEIDSTPFCDKRMNADAAEDFNYFVETDAIPKRGAIE